jgi:hypothetical protein
MQQCLVKVRNENIDVTAALGLQKTLKFHSDAK